MLAAPSAQAKLSANSSPRRSTAKRRVAPLGEPLRQLHLGLAAALRAVKTSTAGQDSRWFTLRTPEHIRPVA